MPIIMAGLNGSKQVQVALRVGGTVLLLQMSTMTEILTMLLVTMVKIVTINRATDILFTYMPPTLIITAGWILFRQCLSKTEMGAKKNLRCTDVMKLSISCRR